MMQLQCSYDMTVYTTFMVVNIAVITN